MSNNTKQTAVPKLRFPEFQGAEEWEEKLLKKVCIINPSHNGLPERFVYIDLESVITGKLLFKKEIDKKDAPSRAQRLIKNYDVIYQIVRPYQKNNLFCNFDDGYNYVASTGYAQLRAFNSSEFLYQLIYTNSFVNEVISKCTGSNYPAINSSDLAKITVFTPSPQEQQKIADCLSSIDALITAQSQKLETLQAHKKGLMQQLFPTEGQTQPKLRFPEFQGAEEWEVKTLGDICNSESSSLALRKLELKQEGYPVYGADGIAGYMDKFQQEKKYISIVKDGAGIGRLNLCEARSSILGTLVCLKSKDQKKFILIWIYYLLNTFDFSFYVKGSGIPHIYYSDFKNEEVFTPSPQEQQKIADCLSSIDALITAQSQKLETLQAHKKGLMQQLFPYAKEMMK